MSISVIGAGAFGTALAITLAQNEPVTLWARDATQAAGMQERRENMARLPGVTLPENVTITAELGDTDLSDVVLLAVPMQKIGAFLREHPGRFDGKTLVSCSKGIDVATLQGATALIRQNCPNARAAILTGPSFAADIARGLPTALTLACTDGCEALQTRLSTPTLRLYRTSDTTGAELGGALKNVYAIGAGVVIGAGLGDSARAALMTRSFAEMQRFAAAQGALPETLAGLSGFGDLVLTCTSPLSRNLQFGLSLGKGGAFDRTITVEGVATAKAVSILAEKQAIDTPIAKMIAALTNQEISVREAVQALLARPLKQE
ncbi:NAD(P)H-dependent glycerol-3-phosphate dehydrogenase [Thioclava sp. A2]|uniref:NAD(P)H-dependent glycerol-3-phosphate dehydrogenase n=1 Tax=Thioclava sp. FCG-A2 TaxID=3080562 RepID=UPI002953D192|nr:NAD(P)H-dependent glycerol-3-phosphate dehydrogenase [Thioclava sp. A2]MDV7270587.1 NAD(P)H-dependent glycerol-3-phosphate dehydrogenase [Thioclava sp. A2]